MTSSRATRAPPQREASSGPPSAASGGVARLPLRFERGKSRPPLFRSFDLTQFGTGRSIAAQIVPALSVLATSDANEYNEYFDNKLQ